MPTSSGIHTRATDIPSRRPQGALGDLVYVSHLNRSKTVTNDNPQSVQIWTVTVDTAVNDTGYTFDVEGVAISFTSDATATTAEIQAGLVAAYNASPVAFGMATAAGTDPDVVITGRNAGINFEVSDSDANLTTVETQDAAQADRIPFARLMVTQGFQSSPSLEANELGALAKSSLLTAQVDTYLMTYQDAIRMSIFVEIEGETYEGSIVTAAASNIATEGALLNTALNAALPANSVVATFATATITLTSEVAGKSFKSWLVYQATVAADPITAAQTKTSTGLVSDDIAKAAVGLSMRRADVENATVAGDDPSYAPTFGVEVLSNGTMWVDSPGAVTPSDPVYVELGVTADNGKFFTAASATRVLLPSTLARWERNVRDSGDLIAALQISL